MILYTNKTRILLFSIYLPTYSSENKIDFMSYLPKCNQSFKKQFQKSFPFFGYNLENDKFKF